MSSWDGCLLWVILFFFMADTCNRLHEIEENNHSVKIQIENLDKKVPDGNGHDTTTIINKNH